MVLKENTVSEVSEVKWIGSSDKNTVVPHLSKKNVCFYKKCIFGPLTINVGDYILVLNADSGEPDNIDDCDVARVLHLYELREMFDKYPYRAVVQWYSRPQSIPHKEFDSDDINIDFSKEVIEEHRPYDPDISLESVFRKCTVIRGGTGVSADDLIWKYCVKKKSSSIMFVCRYKFVKVKKTYRLVPLEFFNDSAEIVASEEKSKKVRRKSCFVDTPKKNANNNLNSHCFTSGGATGRRRASLVDDNAVEFVDLNYLPIEHKVSPIKIVGGRSIVRLSNTSKTLSSPLIEQNVKVTPKSRAAAACRNLNLSLENETDSTAGLDCLNYSIVKTQRGSHESPDSMKIKLRISERSRTRSNSVASIEESDPLALDTVTKSPLNSKLVKRTLAVKTSTPNIDDVYHTPSKKSKESESTPSTRRSILKSASRRLEGTPKRNIKLSDIVEKRIFVDNESLNEFTNNKIVSLQNCNLTKSVLKNSFVHGRHNSPLLCSLSPPSKEKRRKSPSEGVKTTRPQQISPSIEQRTRQTTDIQESDLQCARQQLHVSVQPKSLPCREKEFNNIYTFLEGKIEDQCGGCMYVSGVPGTGKTATVTGVIQTLQRKCRLGKLPPFEFIEINGMRLTEPRQTYVQIYKQLTGKNVSWEHAHSLLEKRFTTPAPRRITTVLLVDELDILCNRRQDVVYNLLDWPTKASARLVVVTIANTMDLPERVLMGKVTSRLGLTRLTFQPYSHKQLQEIVTERLSGTEAFKSDAVQLVARKVAAVSGDARRALDICRRATEIAETSVERSTTDLSSRKMVTMMHVQQALTEMIASAKVQAIKACSRFEQIFLQGVVAEFMRTGVEETTFLNVYSQIEGIASFEGLNVPPPEKCLLICAKLSSERLLLCENSRNIFQKVLLNVSMDDVHYALRVNGI